MPEVIPTFVESFPQADVQADGLEAWTIKSPQARIVVLRALAEVTVPRHHHGLQWGIVLDGQMDLTIGSETTTYRRGDCHCIPAGVDHEATLHAGWRGLYIFPTSD